MVFDEQSRRIYNLSINEASTDLGIQDQLEKFWALETCEFSKNIIPECFKKTTSRTKEGSFMVFVPLRESNNNLCDSYESVKRRFLSMEPKLDNDRILRLQYNAFLKEYEE